MMKRTHSHGCLLLAVLLAFASASWARIPENSPENAGEITVFTAKEIITMNPGWPTVSAVAARDGKTLGIGSMEDLQPAVAVRDGKILTVGSMEDLQPWLDAYPHKHKIDHRFRDKTIMPGFIEPHGHPLLGGFLLSQLPKLNHFRVLNPYGKPFEGLSNREEAIEQLHKYVEEYKSEMGPAESGSVCPDTLLTWGFDVAVFGSLNRHDLDDLDRRDPHKIPLVVWDASEHFVFSNSKFIECQGYTPELAKKVSGVQLGLDGKLNGQFLSETAANYVLSPLIHKRLTPRAVVESLDYMVDLSRQGGITTQSDLMFGTGSLCRQEAIYDAYFNTPETAVRMVAVLDAVNLREQASSMEKAVNHLLRLQDHSSSQLIYNGVKWYSDDSFLSYGMVIENPGYIPSKLDLPNSLFNIRSQDLLERALPFWEAGVQIHVHTNGNGSQDSVLNVLGNLQKRYPRFDHRFVFEHFGISTLSQVKRLQALGAVVSLNPYYVYYRGKINVPHIGTERAYQAAALRTLLDAGVTATLHSDTPVGPPRPLEWAWIAVNRLDYSGESVLAPDERVSVDQALRMITINAAYILGVDDRIGSIEPGKFADFAVLDENPYEVKAEDLNKIGVHATVKGGRVFDVKRRFERPIEKPHHPLLEGVTKLLENPDTLRTLGNLSDCLELDKP